MKKLSLEEIHIRETRMLERVTDICDKNHIRYYICGGTLLGAVRHQGFIPWDDDIDLLFPRPDYLRFIKAVQDQPLYPDYEFRAYELGNLDDPCCRMVDRQTRLVREYTFDEKDKWLWIDVLPMDGCPESDAELASMYRKIHRMQDRLKFMKSINGAGKSRIKRIIKPVLKYPVLVLFGKKRTVKRMTDICMKYPFENAETVAGIAFGYGIQERMVKKDFLEPVQMQFEGLSVTAPGCWEKYLKALYGDYMSIPPVELRKIHTMEVFENDD